jgi:hypothetical protein
MGIIKALLAALLLITGSTLQASAVNDGPMPPAYYPAPAGSSNQMPRSENSYYDIDPRTGARYPKVPRSDRGLSPCGADPLNDPDGEHDYDCLNRRR